MQKRARRLEPALAPSACLLLFLIASLLGCGGANVSSSGKSARTLRSIRISPGKTTVGIGQQTQLSAMGKFSDGSTADVTASAVWTVTPSSVASVSTRGSVTGKAAGSATITASSGLVSGDGTLSVSPPLLLSIVVGPSGALIPLGTTQQLSATGTFNDGSTQDITIGVRWNVLPQAIASVTSTGLLSGKSLGAATVAARSGSVTGAATVSVTPAVLVSIAIQPVALSLAIGSAEQLSAMGTFADGSTQDITGSVTWKSTDSSIAAINSSGKTFGQGVGATTVSASSGSKAGTAAVTVQPALALDYFDGAHTSGVTADGTVQLINPGVTDSDLCAMIYVFNDEQMNECCGCTVSSDGLRTLSLNTDLTSNPLSAIVPPRGIIEVVASDLASNPSCNPASLTPSGLLLGFATHIEPWGGGAFDITEEQLQRLPLSPSHQGTLQSQCAAIAEFGGGQGVCTCGSSN